jgi:hypothetical protein
MWTHVNQSFFDRERGVGVQACITLSKICDKHYGIFCETNILILCMLHCVKLITLCFCFSNICFWYCAMRNVINIANLIISSLPSATQTYFPPLIFLVCIYFVRWINIRLNFIGKIVMIQIFNISA